MKRKTRNFLMFVVLVAILMAGVGSAAAGSGAKRIGDKKVEFVLTLLHNNDGESQVIDAGSGLEDFGGAARFKTVVDNLRYEAENGPLPASIKSGVLMVSSGDNFLAGPEFNASLVKGVPFYDTVAMELIGYDAVSLGNHDFDFGPDVLADFLAGYTEPPYYVAANLDFSGEPGLQAFVDTGVIAPVIVVTTGGEQIGIIGIDTPNLPFISSPRNVVVSDDLANIVQGHIDDLTASGVDKIILAGHLQNIENDRELVGQLDGLDVVIAGGGDELLANPGNLLIPGDESEVYGVYPQYGRDMNGTRVPIVTTSGEYRYVGRLVMAFNEAGELVGVKRRQSGPVRVATGDCNGTLPCDDAVIPDPVMQVLVVDPVSLYLQTLGDQVIGDSEVDLDGLRSSVRSMESNEGNLIADSQWWQATELAPAYGLPLPDVALQNGGGIRNNTIIPAGDITELDTFDMVPFSNFVAIVPDIPRAQFKELLENAVSCTQADDFTNNPNCGSGRFAQVAGFSFAWSAAGDGMIIDDVGSVVQPGTRVLDVVLNDGTVIVDNGVVLPGADINIAITNFLANGGDQYPFRGAPFTTVGVTYQQALSNYIVNGLSGAITAVDYPEGGEGRINNLP